MKRFLLDNISKSYKRRFNKFWDRVSPKNIDIRKMFTLRRRRAKIKKEVQQMQTEKQLESGEEIKQIGEEIEGQEKTKNKDDIKLAPEDIQIDFYSDIQQEDDTPYIEFVQQKLHKAYPTQIYELHELKEVPNSGIIRITRQRDIALEIEQETYQMEEYIDDRPLWQRIITKFQPPYRRMVVDEDIRYKSPEERIDRQPDQKKNFKVAVDSVKDTVQQNMEKNIVLQKSKDIMSKVKEKMNNEVYQYMLENFPDFDIEVFEQEIEYIFTENFNYYLNHDLNSIKDTCLSEAYGFFQSLIEVETSKNGVHKYKSIFNVHTPVLEGSAMIKKQPLFIFSSMHKMKKKQQKVHQIRKYSWIIYYM